MENVYKIMFAAGIVYTVVSLILTGVLGVSHLSSHVGSHLGSHNAGGHHLGHHAGSHGDLGHSADSHGLSQFSWILVLVNPIVLVSFFTIFGGIGIIGTEHFKWISTLVFLIALTSGVLVAFLLYRFIAIPLYKAENTSNVYQEELIGKAAEVDTGILENGFGKIKYTINSIRYTAPAKHIEGKALKQGQKVVICKIEKNVFYVSELEIL
jgi:membrane protein implicated in regulation of membrane protease activity